MYHGLQYPLDETYRLLRQSVCEFAQQRLAPIATAIDQNNEFPLELWQAMGELGLLGITVSDAYGGANMGYLAQAIVMEELSRVSAAVGLSYGAHANLCVNQIYLNGSAEQKERYLPNLIQGKTIGALAMSEANAGSSEAPIEQAAQKVAGQAAAEVLEGVNHPQRKTRHASPADVHRRG